MWRWNSVIRVVIAIITIAFASGCTHTPEAVVSDYLNHTFLDNNGEEAYALLSSDDKLYVDKKEYTRELKRKNVLNKKILDKYDEYFDYEILDTEKRNDTTYVTVMLSKPNAMNVLSNLVDYAMVTAFGTMPERQQMQAISQKFDKIMMSKDRLLVHEERVFKVIREKDDYKIFLDFGFPHRQKKLQAKVDEMKVLAREKEKSMDIDGALNIYGKALEIKADKEVLERRRKLEKVKKNTLSLGESKVFGNVRFFADNIEKRNVKIKRSPIGRASYYEVTEKEYLVLSYTVQNISEGQVFSIEDDGQFVPESVVIDNYGNKMHELLPEYYFDEIENKKYSLLQPGETKKFKAVCEAPLTSVADKFMWKMKLNTANDGSWTYSYISFTKDDIKGQEFLAQK